MLAFSWLCSTYTPWIKDVQRNEICASIWAGCQEDYQTACTFAPLCLLESTLKIRKYNPEVLQRTDYAGGHYDTIFAEMEKQGLIDKRWKKWGKKDPYRLDVKEFFKSHPEIATMLLAQRFSDFSHNGGLKKAARTWKGPVEFESYWKTITGIRSQMMKVGLKGADR